MSEPTAPIDTTTPPDGFAVQETFYGWQYGQIMRDGRILWNATKWPTREEAIEWCRWDNGEPEHAPA